MRDFISNSIIKLYFICMKNNNGQQTTVYFIILIRISNKLLFSIFRMVGTIKNNDFEIELNFAFNVY